jgi:general stress protein YciG
MPLKRQTAANGKCRAATKAGRQCAAPAIRGGIYCALHDDPDRAAQLGRKGGANNRKVYEGNDREIPAPQNACDVKNLLSEAMAEIRASKMDPKLGTTLAYMGVSLLKAIETSDFEKRLERLENGPKDPSQEVGTERG